MPFDPGALVFAAQLATASLGTASPAAPPTPPTDPAPASAAWAITPRETLRPVPITVFGGRELPASMRLGPAVPLRTDGITINREAATIVAKGRFTVSDGFGRLEGDLMDADLKAETLTGRNLRLWVPSYRLEAGEVRIAEGAVNLRDVDLAAHAGGFPLFRLKVREVNGASDSNVELRGIRTSVLGIPLPVVSTARFIARQNRKGNLIPDPASVANQLGEDQLGGARRVGSRWAFGGGVGVSATDPWSLNAQVAYSLISSTVAIERPENNVSVLSDYGGSFYANIRRDFWDDRLSELRHPRLAGIFLWNRHSNLAERGFTTTYNRPYGLGLEVGHALGPTGIRLQARRERISAENGYRADRTVLMGSWVLAGRSFARGLRWDARVDGVSVLQRQGDYSWVRPTLGVSAYLWPSLRVSTAYSYTSTSADRAPFVFDEAWSGSEVIMRIDVFFGETTLGYLNRYNARAGGWYRQQFLVEHPVGALLPWFKYDQKFGNIGFGFTFRTNALRAALTDRQIVRLTRADDRIEPKPTR